MRELIDDNYIEWAVVSKFLFKYYSLKNLLNKWSYQKY